MSQNEHDLDDPVQAHMDLIHSDLPLFDGSESNTWPQSISHAEAIGCASRVRFGDWALLRRDGEVVDWYRFGNYGVFHCWAVVSNTYEREGLAGATTQPSFFVHLDTLEDRELWAIQIGARPGSDFILLSRDLSDEPIDEFEVLQVKCPSAHIRDAGSLDILITRYCAINSRAALFELVHDMARYPSYGTLTLVGRDSKTTE